MLYPIVNVIVILHLREGIDMNCYRCGAELKSIACKSKCLNCGYSLDCNDM